MACDQLRPEEGDREEGDREEGGGRREEGGGRREEGGGKRENTERSGRSPVHLQRRSADHQRPGLNNNRKREREDERKAIRWGGGRGRHIERWGMGG
jgi:hypothetical protein